MELSHIAPDGSVKMVGVGEKAVTKRTATAEGRITMRPETLIKIKEGAIKKGDVLAAAKIAGIMAAKKTADLIPLCHNIPLDNCEINFEFLLSGVKVTARAEATAKTGVEMEALIAAATALVTIYDMAKAIDKAMTIEGVRLIEKTGGKSGTYRREE
ncbi:MAG TPA: cyclic pyranopterin monophosphate synthase MoaC [Eubacteriales bacterium]|jgi:cyclic pyranopterin phosphate synthase|nr:cyclic pyranopterin monophosphate synthase MoaC [Clostridia bacterium]HRR90095.1 cyclic pyranopterin monophosphate synthase MoaC [Eubacteriales bacterium]HRU83888.1 cyclic pyranopterin monophosphate synthase MoaC [Eubacteriales bacterium]